MQDDMYANGFSCYLSKTFEISTYDFYTQCADLQKKTIHI